MQPLVQSLSILLGYPKERDANWSSSLNAGLGLGGWGRESPEMKTVSACVFDIAKVWGCKGIFFVGQDLAARTDGQL